MTGFAAEVIPFESIVSVICVFVIDPSVFNTGLFVCLSVCLFVCFSRAHIAVEMNFTVLC